VREVEKFDRMEHRDRCAARDLRDAADVAGGGEIGRGLHDIRNLAVAQPQGDLAGALKSYQDSLSIRDRLAKSDPGNAGWQRDRSVSFAKLLSVHWQSGDNAKALDFFRHGQAIMARLTKLSPDNATWKHDLARFEGEIGGLAKK
jgi:hypothetical protein